MEGNMRNDVANALLRAFSALVPTPAPGRLSATHQGVETSLDTARKSACATWLLLAAACPFLAQTPLTLQDAEALAIKNHPQVQAAQLNYQASQQAVAEARSAYFPTLQGDVTASQGNPQARIGAGHWWLRACGTASARVSRSANSSPIRGAHATWWPAPGCKLKPVRRRIGPPATTCCCASIRGTSRRCRLKRW